MVGSNKYVHVLDSTGNLKGSWSYKEEIKGTGVLQNRGYWWIGGKLYEIKDANARAISVADLDSDNEPKIVVGFGRMEDRLDQNYYFGSIRVFEINKKYQLPTKATTTVETTQERPTTPTPVAPTTIVAQQPAQETEKGKGLFCLSAFLPIILLGFSLLFGVWVR